MGHAKCLRKPHDLWPRIFHISTSAIGTTQLSPRSLQLFMLKSTDGGRFSFHRRHAAGENQRIETFYPSLDHSLVADFCISPALLCRLFFRCEELYAFSTVLCKLFEEFEKHSEYVYVWRHGFWTFTYTCPDPENAFPNHWT